MSKRKRGIAVVLVGALGLAGCSKASYEYMEGARDEEPAETGEATELSRIRLSDRFFVRSALLDIFGAPTGANGPLDTLLNDMVMRNVAAFGGPCDLASITRANISQPDLLAINPCGPTFDLTRETQFTQADLVPSAMVTREGFRLQVCERIVANDGWLGNAVAKVSATPDQTGDSAAVTKAFRLFYVGQTPSPEVLAALEGVSTAAQSSYDVRTSWRMLFYTLCASAGWQLP